MTTEVIYPLTLGLLASIALRMDHAFAAPDFEGSFYLETQEVRQRESLYRAFCIYQKEVSGNLKNSNNVTEKQCREELTGQGFYKPSHEGWYVSLICDKAMSYAKGLVSSI